jgi:hypothetical protein
MPWTAVHLTDGAYLRFSGAVTGEELVRANMHFYRQAYKGGPRFAVFDFTDVERFHVDTTSISRIAAQDTVAAAAAIPELVVAVVAPQLLVFGMLRMWEMQVGETGWHIKVARSRAEAFSWLENEGIATERFAALQD